MSFSIPNLPSSPTAMQSAQSSPDAVDFAILSAGNTNTGVVAGCLVTWTSVMGLSVANGTVRTGGNYVPVGTQALTVSAADATNPRFDMVVSTSGGIAALRAGTAAAIPVFPTLTAGDVALASVYVPATATVLAATNLIDKRIFLDVSPTLGTFNVFNYGATGNWKTVADGAITTGTATLTSSTAAFTPADVGKYISVSAARSGTGAVAVWLNTTILAYVNATTVTLATNAGKTVSSATVDWATDDTTAIQAAIDAVPVTGGNVLLPTGTYLISQTLKLGSGVRLRGLDPSLTTIKVKNGFAPTIPTAGASLWYGPSAIATKATAGATSNIGIYDLTIDHNFLLLGTAWRWYPIAGGGASNLNTDVINLANAHTIDMRYSMSSITIANVKIRNPARYSVHILGGLDLAVRNCDIQTGANGATGYANTVNADNTTVTGGTAVSAANQQDAIHLDDCQRVDIGYNTINTCGLTPGTSPYGYNGGGDDCVALLNFSGEQATSGVNIHNNIFYSGQNCVGVYEQSGITTSNVNITENICIQAVYSFASFQHFSGSAALANITIANNIILAALKINTNFPLATNAVFNLQRNQTTATDDVTGLTIKGNQINGTGMLAYADGAATGGVFRVVDFNRSSDVVFEGNTVTNWSGHDGIYASSQVRDYTISNNVIDMTSMISGSYGLALLGALRGTISGNVIKGTVSGSRGISILGNDGGSPSTLSQYNIVANNTLYNWATGYGETALGGATTSVLGNLFIGNLTPGCTAVSAIIAGTTTVEVQTGAGVFLVSDPISGTNLDENGFYYPKTTSTGAAFTQVASTTYYQYIGRAKKAYTSAVVRVNVTTAGVTLSFAEVGIFTGTIVTPGTVPTLTKNGTQTITLTTPTGMKSATVTLTGITPGTDLWVVVGVGTQSTAVQYTSTTDVFSWGATASNAQRPSTATTTTPTGVVTAIPAMSVRFS